MIEIELFYRTVEAEMRSAHTCYLQSVKNVPLPLDLPEVTELPSDEEMAAMSFWQRFRVKRRHRKEKRARAWAERHPVIPVDVRLLKGYNAGMETALRVLRSEFNSFMKRSEREGRDA